MKNIPRMKIAHLPTPVGAMPRLSDNLGGPRLLVKRDDQTSLAFGGNKTRKLEYLLAEAKANGAKTIITTGAAQSNHCRQTAAASALMGFECVLLLVGEPPEFYSGNLLLDHLFNAEIIWTTREERDEKLQSVFEIYWSNGRRPYLVPYGGSSETGVSAYVHAMKELLAQDIKPDWIVFASSSGGTQAGLVLGAKTFGFSGKILGISVDEQAGALQEQVVDLANRCAVFLDIEERVFNTDVLVNYDYLGGGYGIMGEAEQEAIRLFARYEGLLLDPVYTGRAAAGLIDLVRKNFFSHEQTVLFWHTGGTPALFADQYRTLGIVRTADENDLLH